MSETTTSLLLVISGACALLLVATIGGEILRLRLSPRGNHPTVETYTTRLHSWWGMVFLVSVALLSGHTGVVLLFAFASFAALREFLTLTRKTKADHWALIGAFYIVFPLQYLFIWMGAYGLYSIFIPVYAFLILPILSALRGAGTNFLSRVSETQWGLMICVFGASHIPALVTLDIHGSTGRSVLLIAFLVVVVQIGDLAEYYAGRRIGKTRIAPAISPKTKAGVICGASAAMATGFLLTWLTPFAPLEAIAVSLAIYLFGVGGSLVLAAIKADRGVKNWGHLIPGQGGFVDQMDSVVFAAPIFFHLTRYLYGA
ncbi:MAG: phosphatidate cytidylyltransferase [Litoreibacter sp.]|nr:phosphatidate cytidylyltransferase [Litoreibacter sp.]